MQNSPSGDCVKIYSNGCIDFDTASTEYNNVQRDFSIYHNKLFQKLRNNTRCLSGGPYATTVTINRESTESLLLKYQISRSSGNKDVDDFTLKMLCKMYPFEPIPSCGKDCRDFNYSLIVLYNRNLWLHFYPEMSQRIGETMGANERFESKDLLNSSLMHCNASFCSVPKEFFINIYDSKK